jgi:hypothetical protein
VSSWWLSFADADRPESEQFLGACIVTGDSLSEALQRSYLLECNPGGEVRVIRIAADTAPYIEDKWRRRILTRVECIELDQHLQEVCAAAAERAKSS